MMNYGRLFEDQTIVNLFNKIDNQNTNQFNHGLTHVMNVIKTMKKLIKLLEIKRPESDYLLIACVLHDVGQLEGSENHYIRSKDFAEKYLENKIETNWLNQIVSAIETHHQKEDMDDLPLFNHLVLFADKMDFTKKRLEKKFAKNAFEQHINEVDFIIENNTFKILITTDKEINSDDFLHKFEYSTKIISRIKQFAQKLKLNYEILLDNQKIEIKSE